MGTWDWFGAATETCCTVLDIDTQQTIFYFLKATSSPVSGNSSIDS